MFSEPSKIALCTEVCKELSDIACITLYFSQLVRTESQRSAEPFAGCCESVRTMLSVGSHQTAHRSVPHLLLPCLCAGSFPSFDPSPSSFLLKMSFQLSKRAVIYLFLIKSGTERLAGLEKTSNFAQAFKKVELRFFN